MNYLTIHEVEATLATAMEQSARDHLMLLLSFRHGMRRGEIAQLTLNDIQHGQIRIKRLKGSLETTQPLMTSENEVFDEVAALERWLKFRPAYETNYLFPSPSDGPMSGRWIDKIAKKYLRSTGVAEKLTHHHAFKHACCSILLRNGATIEYVAQVVGHRDIKNTRIYLNITDQEAMGEAGKALSLALGGVSRALGATVAG